MTFVYRRCPFLLHMTTEPTGQVNLPVAVIEVQGRLDLRRRVTRIEMKHAESKCWVVTGMDIPRL
jgi:hypothetical protein